MGEGNTLYEACKFQLRRIQHDDQIDHDAHVYSDEISSCTDHRAYRAHYGHLLQDTCHLQTPRVLQRVTEKYLVALKLQTPVIKVIHQ